MSNNGMNYHMYNTFPYSQIVRQRFPNSLSQPPVPQYGGYQMYPSMQTQPHYDNSYDHLIQSAAETLAAFTSPSELPPVLNNHQLHISQQHSNRRPVKNSSNAKTPNRTYYCETCRIACRGLASYQAHLNGSKHIKKGTNSQNQQANPSIFRCELCDITCTNPDAYKSHLEGSKHDKTVKLHRKLGKTIPEQSSVLVNESQTVILNEVKQSSDNIIKFVGIEYIETSYDDKNVIKSYYCNLCDCKFNDSNAKDEHLNGKRHRLAYKKKINSNFQVDENNKTELSSPKQSSNDATDGQIHSNFTQTEIDDDTKYLMILHEQIIPTQSLLNTAESFVSAVEAALKSCSDQLHPSETVIDKPPLVGVSRIGLLVKNLMIKSDRLFHLVVICTEWPTTNLFEKVFSILSDNFHETWKNQINIRFQKDKEIIQVYTDTDEGQMSVSISFTSLSTRPEGDQTTNCVNALNAMQSVQWFQKQVSTRQHASALIRCLRYKTKISQNWQSLSSEAIEILVEHTLSKSVSPVCAFRRVLEYLSGGLILPNSPGLRLPWQNDSIEDVFENLSNQDRNDITHEAQIGLRLMAFGQLSKWLEQNDIPQGMKSFEKRSYSDHDNEISPKRQRIKSGENEEQ